MGDQAHADASVPAPTGPQPEQPEQSAGADEHTQVMPQPGPDPVTQAAPQGWQQPGGQPPPPPQPQPVDSSQPAPAQPPPAQPAPAPPSSALPAPVPPSPVPPPGPLTDHQGSDFPPPPTGDVDERRPHRRRRAVVSAVAVTALLLASLAAGYTGAWLHDRPREAPVFTTVDAGPVSRPDGSVASVAAQVLPSVVSIEVAVTGGLGSGSGFVIDSDGYVLTNNHVIDEAADSGEIVVVFSDGSQEVAEVVGRTTPYDLAVLKVDRTGLPELEFADSEGVVVGDPVVAVGAPLGLESTVTTGIVSAKNRPVSAGVGDESAYINAIQTDAAINPGNSGGPLVDLDGRVIGVNSAIARAPGALQGQGNIGLGFAIPSDQAVRTVQELVETGTATYPVIGVLLDRRYRGEGVKVVEEAPEGQDVITPGGPAEGAGIEPGDLIVAFEGRPVTDPDELIVAIRAKRPGDSVTITIRRDGQDRQVELVLEEAESQ